MNWKAVVVAGLIALIVAVWVFVAVPHNVQGPCLRSHDRTGITQDGNALIPYRETICDERGTP